MPTTTNTLQLLKENDQDFEWYPTTNDMIWAVFCSCHNSRFDSMLDIGAGDGRVLKEMDRLCYEKVCKKEAGEGRKNYEYRDMFTKYAIEKSTVHIDNMPESISIIGTDFMLQTLIDKQVDIIFCNPPYSQFEAWATKTIKEANAKEIYLILPARWTESKLIEQALKQRKLNSTVIWSGDFLKADRQARARVDVIKIVISDSYNDYDRRDRDPFKYWFEEYFSGFSPLDPVDEDEDEDEKEEKIDPMKNIVPGRNLIEHLHLLYMDEMKLLLDNYKKLSEISISLLKELGVEVGNVREALKLKISGLKNKYWKELFDNLDKITHKLTSSSRNRMLEKLNASCSVDFSVDNAYAVVIWVIKNANKYIDEQLIEIFKKLSEPESIKNYKSNQKVWEKDRWRCQDEHNRYMLEYRIISNQYYAIHNDPDGFGKYDYPNGLAKDCHKFINDIFTIANNLGFSNYENSYHVHWASNTQQEFYLSGGGDILVAIRAFKNGNLHLKFNQKFIKTLNIEASRLLGWIKSPQEAVDEMGLDMDFVKDKFESNKLFGIVEGRKLLTGN